ncbi:5-oxoprolinase subunit PxpB [Gelidibacter salicanalis]|uniref:5-oxoprolinase subunit PxpB n=1 Tax=Gelidibacter salicanalis TaxID=291193 RepID=A0A934KI65_9FLAO|nr:5-oxoprolinase subunit PxpB [Gelidibacter salicanalis]MBJ7879966.1 5-oxoprolinase subunit PxpB [Gelidibacter salicanalis]
MSPYKLTYTRFSEKSILIQWPEKIDPEILEDLLFYKEKILKSTTRFRVQVINTYNTLLVTYDTSDFDFKKEITRLKSVNTLIMDVKPSQHQLWKIPVCYDAHFGLDLEYLATVKNISTSDLIKWHTAARYKVYFIGFLPGFLYLGGLDKRLIIPRRNSPRHHIKKGAVGIGGEQTGIYPNASPGGWNIIGNSPISFFDSERQNPCFATAGDSIQFVPINLDMHRIILEKIENRNYVLESEVCDG